MSIPIDIREATPDDLPFFYSATLQSHFYNSPTNRYTLPSVYYPEHKNVLERLLRNSRNHLRICCLSEDPSVILGFALAQPLDRVLHYAYIKRSFRRFGIMHDLLHSFGLHLGHCTVSHWTEDLARICRAKMYPNLTYNPYLLVGEECRISPDAKSKEPISTWEQAIKPALDATP